jgi:hypothetical protein
MLKLHGCMSKGVPLKLTLTELEPPHEPSSNAVVPLISLHASAPLHALLLITVEPEDLEQLLNPPQLFRPISNVSEEY